MGYAWESYIMYMTTITKIAKYNMAYTHANKYEYIAFHGAAQSATIYTSGI